MSDTTLSTPSLIMKFYEVTMYRDNKGLKTQHS